MLKGFVLGVCLLMLTTVFGYTGKISGTVKADGKPVEFASISIESLKLGVSTNKQGKYFLSNIPEGNYEMTISFVGYQNLQKSFTISHENLNLNLNIDLSEKSLLLDEVVVTGTKTFKRKTESPVIVNVTSSAALESTQSCNLAEGLKFQPGLRVETDCQTCNYTQLRMNGLAGGYSQILVNGRPIFSPLTGLYGMEQLPVNMIERIEVVRGGGSSLYGSSAVGGTVNVITKIPKQNSYDISNSFQLVNGQSTDNMLLANATILDKDLKSGASFFFNKRDRDFYDHNDDNFSELPLLNTIAFGTNLFFLPEENQKLELSLSHMNEYRIGGEMRRDTPAYLAQQSEERTHHVWMASADYQVNFNNQKTTFISYAAWQNTNRKHYTGITPDDSLEYQNHISTPPYGTSLVQTFNLGVQMNHKLSNFLKGENILTLGTEYIYDDVIDQIPAFAYIIDQTTRNFGSFFQSDWKINSQINLLAGFRLDDHSLISNVQLNPRASLLYKMKDNIQFRANYGTGFRAPQAFDADMHMAFAGGGISRVVLSPNLMAENSNSFNLSMNYDKAKEKYIWGYTIEAFHTELKNAFILNPIGEDAFGEVFQKENGQGATVQGITLETRINYDSKWQLEGGFTLQSSEYEETVEYIDGIAGTKSFIRTPNDYGFASLTITPKKAWSLNINYVYTGSMIVPHFAGAENFDSDVLLDTESFSDLSLKFSYALKVKKTGNKFELFTGVKNVFNSYQNNFDIGKNRDSNFVYGPSLPRTFFFGLKVGKL
jgi:outer membrane receptor for ferrienterochelin and colicins